MIRRNQFNNLELYVKLRVIQYVMAAAVFTWVRVIHLFRRKIKLKGRATVFVALAERLFLHFSTRFSFKQVSVNIKPEICRVFLLS